MTNPRRFLQTSSLAALATVWMSTPTLPMRNPGRWHVIAIDTGETVPTPVVLPHPAPPSPILIPTPTARLSVRPHEMATGTRTARAGEQRLDSLDDYLVYVPKQCVGTRRVPLVVQLPGGGETSQSIMDHRWGRELADRYGMILLVPNAVTDAGYWDVITGLPGRVLSGQTEYTFTADSSIQVLTFQDSDVRNIDAALKQVLRTFAIDPDRIAVAGASNGGSYALFVGRNNLDVFSRIGAMEALNPFYGTGPQNSKTQFFVSGGIGIEDDFDMVEQTLRLTHELRHEGHPVETVLLLHGDVDYKPDYEYLWSWLAKSWGLSGPEAPPYASTVADSDPLLTVAALTHMTAFWTRFMQEPDSIQTTGRLARQERITMAIGSQPVSVIKANMAALAATYPAVAADLKASGLTPQQEEAYRAALLRVWFTQQARTMRGPIAATSVLGKNMAFIEANADAFKQLEATGMWTTQ
jgi:phospholipase/carboxylesterase